jgi:hypothetical protein
VYDAELGHRCIVRAMGADGKRLCAQDINDPEDDLLDIEASLGCTIT